MRRKYDAVVLGAGVAGLGAAIGLAEEGKKVLVLSKKIRGAASPASAGILDPFLEMNPHHPLFPLCKAAFRRWPSFLKKIERATGKKVGYRKTGMLFVALAPAEERELKQRLAWQKKTGIPVRWLSRGTILKKHPDVTPKVLGGLFYPTVGRVQPKKLVAAMMRYAKRLGVRFRFQKVPFQQKQSRRCQAPQKVPGTFYLLALPLAPVIINATGSWAGKRKNLGMRLPILPVRGQILLLKGRLRISTILHTLDGGYVVPWETGSTNGQAKTYLVGSTVEFAGYHPTVTTSGLKDMMRRNERMLPRLRHCKRIDAWAGLRPYSQKRLPLIGPSKIKGLYLAAGYYRSGILISGTAGKLLAKTIISGKMPAVLKPFQPKRFGL